MKPPVETLRINRKGREQLIRLKRVTGIQNWNILCRWAFYHSIKQQSQPPEPHDDYSTSVEIAWKTFVGNQEEDIVGLLFFSRFNQQNSKALTDHIHRGLDILDSTTKNLEDLVESTLSVK